MRYFRTVAHGVANGVGSPWAFMAGLLIVLAWGITGPLFHYSDTWQLVINTGTNIVTFLMVFLIQSTQNRHAQAMQLKLDELIRVSTARNLMLGLEDSTDEELMQVREEFARIRTRLRNGEYKDDAQDECRPL